MRQVGWGGGIGHKHLMSSTHVVCVCVCCSLRVQMATFWMAVTQWRTGSSKETLRYPSIHPSHGISCVCVCVCVCAASDGQERRFHARE